jgi:quercetin dioxygenase-like cupin family protein
MDGAEFGLIVAPDAGRVWDMEPGRPTTFKLTSDETGGSAAVFEESVPVGAGTPLHIHHAGDEIIHLLSGELTLKLGSRTTSITGGTWVFIPRRTPHAWRNSGTGTARASFVFTPAESAKFFEQLRLLAQPIPSIPTEVLGDLCQRYGYELVSFEWT